MTLQDRIVRAQDRLARAGISAREANLDARLLARHVLGWDAARLIAALHEPAPFGFDSAYEPVIARRERREPAAQILGTREFWGLSFEVTPDVLTPRPETELLVEMTIAILHQSKGATAANQQDATERRPDRSPKTGALSPRVLDVGTGSGCVAIAIANSCPDVRIIATDVSAAALTVARRNATRLGVADRVRLVQTDLLAGIRPGADLVVSNPPYVRDEDLPALPPEVRNYEPHAALFGGPGGLHLIARLIDQAVPRIRPGGWLLFELGNAQAAGVEELISADARCTIVEMRGDLQGIPRAALVNVNADV